MTCQTEFFCFKREEGKSERGWEEREVGKDWKRFFIECNLVLGFCFRAKRGEKGEGLGDETSALVFSNGGGEFVEGVEYFLSCTTQMRKIACFSKKSLPRGKRG